MHSQNASVFAFFLNLHWLSFPTLILIYLIEALVFDNPVEPCGKSGTKLKFSDIFPCRKKRILSDISRILMVTEHTVSDVVNPMLITNHKGSHRVGIAILTAQNDLTILCKI